MLKHFEQKFWNVTFRKDLHDAFFQPRYSVIAKDAFHAANIGRQLLIVDDVDKHDSYFLESVEYMGTIDGIKVTKKPAIA